MCCGWPSRTGTWNTSSASSMAPSILALPPVSTMPAAMISSKPERRSSSRARPNNSSYRGSTTSASVWRARRRARAIAHRRHLDALVGIGELRQRAGVAHLDVLGVLRGRAHRHRDVVGDLVAGDRYHRRVANGALREHREVGGAAADVDDADAEFLLVLGEAGEARGELLEHDVVDLEPAALDALLDVLRGAVGAGDDVHLGLEPHAGHADGIADAFLPVDDEFLRQHVQDLLVRRDGHRLGRVDHVLHVRRR